MNSLNLLKKITGFSVAYALALFPAKSFPVKNTMATRDTSRIARDIDVSVTTRDFPSLVAYRNTSIQKAPAPVIAEVSEKELGRPAVTRCWLNLDEMWDYRTRTFDFNFRIGVDKYKSIADKQREAWDWEEETNIRYYDYLKAFSRRSDEIMLTIRRYERDALDGKLPVTMSDWKMLFKTGLKHYKMLCPNIRYVEVCNEPHIKSFMHATDEEYYQFYKLGYEAVAEVNEELRLEGRERILVGGPVITGNTIKLLDSFFRLYSRDSAPHKKLDFVAWHEYSIPVDKTAYREKEVRNLMEKYNLDKNLPFFISEHDPYHFSEDKHEYHYQNAAGLVKTLYFSSLYSPNVMIMPWVLYHNSKIQTRFMWFEGPNNSDTKYEEIKILPSGVSMKLLSQLKGREIRIDNSIQENDLVIGAFDGEKVLIEAVNYGSAKPVSLMLSKVQSLLGTGRITVTKYIVDTGHNSYLTDKKQTMKINPDESRTVDVEDKLELKHESAGSNSIIFWEIKKAVQ